MPAASQTPVIWTVIVASLVLLVSGIMGLNSLSNAVNTSTLELENKISSQLDSKVDSLQTTAESLLNYEFDTSSIRELCDETDGCGGWWDSDQRTRHNAVDRVTEELTENNNRDLFDEIENLVKVDDEEDIEDVEVHRIGEVRQNEDPDYDASDERLITVDYILEVSYFEDGDSDDTKTKYFRVQATLSDLEDGISESDVQIDSVTKVRKDFSLP